MIILDELLCMHTIVSAAAWRHNVPCSLPHSVAQTDTLLQHAAHGLNDCVLDVA